MELVEIEKRKVLTNTASSSQSAGAPSSDKNEKTCSEGVLLHISSHLILFIQARLHMLSLYPFKLINIIIFLHIKYPINRV